MHLQRSQEDNLKGPRNGTTEAADSQAGQSLLRHLGLDDAGDAGRAADNPTRSRILDMATELFIAKGISATTMREIATNSGVSRAWLYRQFASRDDIVQAVIVREGQRVSKGMVEADQPDRPVEESVTRTFVYIVGSVRTNPLVQRFLAHEQQLVSSFIVGGGSGPFIRAMVQALENYLQQRAGLPQTRSRIAAEAIIRLVVSTGLTPIALLDFDDPDQLRTFAEQVIPPLIRAG